MSEQKYCDLTASNSRPSTPHYKEPGRMLLDVDKTCADIFDILARFLENLLESENSAYNATTGAKTALGITQLWFNHFMASFFEALGLHFSREAEERDVP